MTKPKILCYLRDTRPLGGVIFAAEGDPGAMAVVEVDGRLTATPLYEAAEKSNAALREALENTLRRFENCARHVGNDDETIAAATSIARAALAAPPAGSRDDVVETLREVCRELLRTSDPWRPGLEDAHLAARKRAVELVGSTLPATTRATFSKPDGDGK